MFVGDRECLLPDSNIVASYRCACFGMTKRLVRACEGYFIFYLFLPPLHHNAQFFTWICSLFNICTYMYNCIYYTPHIHNRQTSHYILEPYCCSVVVGRLFPFYIKLYVLFFSFFLAHDGLLNMLYIYDDGVVLVLLWFILYWAWCARRVVRGLFIKRTMNIVCVWLCLGGCWTAYTIIWIFLI